MRIAVTGSSGKLGSATVQWLRAAGHEVTGFDRTGTPAADFVQVDLEDYGQVLDALIGVTARHQGLDALVHLAALPVNGLIPDAATFTNNNNATFHVLHGALRAGITKVVMASSITAVGFPTFSQIPLLPVPESYHEANVTYALGKISEEAVAAQLVRWQEGMRITALRFTNIVGPDDYADFAQATTTQYRRNLLHSYLDVRDGAAAVGAALKRHEPGFNIYNIAAAESSNTIPSAQLAARNFPGVPVQKDMGEFEPLFSVRKAKRDLGFTSSYHWRTEYERCRREQRGTA